MIFKFNFVTKSHKFNRSSDLCIHQGRHHDSQDQHSQDQHSQGHHRIPSVQHQLQPHAFQCSDLCIRRRERHDNQDQHSQDHHSIPSVQHQLRPHAFQCNGLQGSHHSQDQLTKTSIAKATIESQVSSISFSLT